MVTVERAVIAGLVATLVGVGYAAAVHGLERRQPGHPYTASLVVAGVLLTLLVALLVVPWEWVVVQTGLFALTGVWQVLGSMYRYLSRERAAAQADVRAIRRAVGATDERIGQRIEQRMLKHCVSGYGEQGLCGEGGDGDRA